MSDGITVALPEDCRLTSIRDCRNTILEAFHRSGDITLDLSAVAHVDASFVQLLVSAGKTADRKERRLALTGTPAIVDAALRRAGLDPAALARRPA